MKLPGGERAAVDISKLTDYCLNPHHPRGRHKARVFLSVLGLSSAEAELLRTALLRAARESDASQGQIDAFGIRYTVDFEFPHAGRNALIRSAWLVPHDQPAPRLTTCFVLLG